MENCLVPVKFRKKTEVPKISLNQYLEPIQECVVLITNNKHLDIPTVNIPTILRTLIWIALVNSLTFPSTWVIKIKTTMNSFICPIPRTVY